MKKILVLVFILIITVNAFAEEKELITVMDFSSNNFSEMDVIVFVDYLSSQIQNTGEYRVIDRMQRENILSELEFSNSGCTDESCQLEIGRLLSARKVIVGSIGSIGNKQILNVKLIDVETSETINSASKKYADMDEMLSGSDILISELFGLSVVTKTPIAVKARPDDESVIEKVNYSETLPWLDLAIPGFSHFQAGTTGMGIVYLGTAIGGAALLGVSEYMYSAETEKYKTADNTADADSLYARRELWRILSIVGAGVWGLSAIGSTTHGLVAKAAEVN